MEENKNALVPILKDIVEFEEVDFKGDSNAFYNYKKDKNKLIEKIESGKLKDEKIKMELAKFKAKHQNAIIKAEQKLAKKIEKEKKAEEKRLAKYRKSDKYMKEQLEREHESYEIFIANNQSERSILYLLITHFKIEDKTGFINAMKTPCSSISAFEDTTICNIDFSNDTMRKVYISALVRILAYIKVYSGQFEEKYNLNVDKAEELINNMIDYLVNLNK